MYSEGGKNSFQESDCRHKKRKNKGTVIIETERFTYVVLEQKA